MNIKNKYFNRLIVVLMLGMPIVSQAALPEFTQIVDQAKNSVVNISTVNKPSKSKSGRSPSIPGFSDKIEGERPRTPSLGSGFIISKDGYILTNHHVISGAEEVIVRLSNREEYVAEIIGSDKASDIAVLKVNANDLAVLKFGDSDKLKVGEWVLAIGSPFGFDHSVTAGIVSAKGRSLPSDNYVPFIQTDVAINPGNSGGPLFNMDGEVVGINSQIYSRTGGFMGLSFAIPIEMAIDVTNQIKETGYVSRGWLGVLIQEVTRELAESFGMDTPHGALVAKVFEDSPAAESDLHVGDVIVEFNGKKVLRSSSLPPLVGRSPVGKKARIGVIRNRSSKLIEVKIAELPSPTTPAANTSKENDSLLNNSALGMSVGKLPKSAKTTLKLQSGVLVISVEKSGAAREAGIAEGDIITMIDNQKVTSVRHFKELAGGLNPGRPAALLVQRKSGPTFLAISPEDS